MNRAILLNAAIAALALASVAVVAVTRRDPTTGESEARSHDLLPEFRNAEVTRFEIEHDAERLVIERAPNSDGGSAEFRLTAPVKEPADAATVEKLSNALGGARALRSVPDADNLARFGLAEPHSMIRVFTDKTPTVLALGGRAAAPEGARYLRVTRSDGSSAVVVVDKALAEDLSVELDAFRERSLVTLSEADVTRIQIRSPHLNVGLSRGNGVSFVLDGTPSRLADRDAVSALFFQMARLSADHFLAAADAEAALGPNRAHFEFEAKEPARVVSFDIGGVCPADPARWVMVRRAPNPQSGCTTRELEATLRSRAEDLQDRHPFSLHPDEVEELDIKGQNYKFELLRKGSAFVLHGSTESQVELDAGNQRIKELLSVTAEIVDKKPSELGLEAAQRVVTLRSSAARAADVVEQVVRVGSSDGAGNLWLYREEDGAVLRVTRESARAFAPDSTLLYDHKLTEFGLSSFVSAEIVSASGKQVLRRGANEALQLDEPRGFDVDGGASGDLIQALGSLTADRFVADRDDGSFGLAKPSVSVRFVFKDETKTQVDFRLRFGAETALGVFATLGDDGPVFVLPRSVRDACDTLLINRTLFQTNADAFTSITLDAHGRALHLQRRGERFEPEPAAGFPRERVSSVLEALSNLSPDAALHVGPALPTEGFAEPYLTVRLRPKVGAAQTVSFGAGDAWRSTSIFYVRVSGIDATFVMAQSKVRALSDAL